MLRTIVKAIFYTWEQLDQDQQATVQKRWENVIMPWDLKRLNWTHLAGEWTPSEQGTT